MWDVSPVHHDVLDNWTIVGYPAMADLLVKYPEQLTETLQTGLDGGEVYSKEVEVDDPGHRGLTGEAGERDLVVG